MPEEPPRPPLRRFPPVSVTRFVPVTRSPEPRFVAAEGASVAAGEPAPGDAEPQQTAPAATPVSAPAAGSSEPLAEFQAVEDTDDSGSSEPEPRTRFTAVGAATTAPAAPPPRPAPVLNAEPAAARPRPTLGAAVHAARAAQRPSAPVPGRPGSDPFPLPQTPPPAPRPAPEPPRAHADVDAAAAAPLPGASILQPLQFGLVSHAAPTTRVEPPAEAAGTRSRIPAILVVDDNADYRFVVVREMRRLRPNQIRIEEADGAQAALGILANLLRENQRVFLLTDFRMPNQTGVDLVQAVRRAYPTADLKYLVYSGINLRSSPELQSLGPDEFMEKPGDLIELRRQMGRLLERWIGSAAQVRTA